MNRPIPRTTRLWLWMHDCAEETGHRLVEVVCAVLLVLVFTGVIK